MPRMTERFRPGDLVRFCPKSGMLGGEIGIIVAIDEIHAIDQRLYRVLWPTGELQQHALWELLSLDGLTDDEEPGSST